jgi:aldose 1-epimerase
MPVTTRVFGHTQDGTEVHAHTVTPSDGDLPRLEVIEVGAAVTSLQVADRDGHPVDVVLGYPELVGYEQSEAYFGAVVGRYANRLAEGRFVLDGETFTVPANEGQHALHGGPDGFDKRVWTTGTVGEDEVTLTLVSDDGDQGFPGRVEVSVSYAVRDQEVQISYRASTDRSTVVNLTNHSYFHLDGPEGGTIDEHLLSVAADGYTPAGPELVPTGEVAPVDGTPLDLRTPTRIGPRVREPHPQLLAARGIDHNLVVAGEGLRRHATLHSPASGITLEVLSDQPGIQVYTGNFLDGSIVGSAGRTYRQGGGIALETQHFPDSPNQPDFPSTTLRPGEEFRSTTVWRFR